MKSFYCSSEKKEANAIEMLMAGGERYFLESFNS